ncbi:hypothetical protein GN244_ATG08477 [Phytophthora infestans]|uniref:Uncharacterized protein n=1 Tax=Phytophthora infestans TaxID=4787 RepID=A0A833TA74_PHYIN|nr:hypothetical protein GN244_ATG08477 [Phytophthora infestans]KAF4132330.1 hypothetical protein GN958_ATG18447 [Phytophthora infestans]
MEALSTGGRTDFNGSTVGGYSDKAALGWITVVVGADDDYKRRDGVEVVANMVRLSLSSTT